MLVISSDTVLGSLVWFSSVI